MRRTAVALAFAALGVLDAACGGPKQDGPPPNLDVPKLGGSKPAGAGGAAAGAREVSDAIRQHWPFDERVKLAAYADVDTMMKMDLFRALSQVADEKCLAELLPKMRELAFGTDSRGVLAIARFADPFPEDAIRTCVTKADEKKLVLETTAPLAFLGDAALVDAASAGAGADARAAAGAGKWPATLTVSQDKVVAWSMNAEGITAKGGVHASNERFRIDATADVPEELGQLMEEQLGRGAPLGPLAKSLKVERHGRRLDIVFELREPPVDQARDLGILGALAAHGVRSYLTRSKAAEARNTLGAIARDYVSDWEREDPSPRSKRKLQSYPPVPKTVPRGTTYASTDKDWAPWKSLHFSMTMPQRYQYEIVAAKDGESAEIIARGDLDGDGRTSTFKVMVKIDRAKDVLVVAPTISETDPDE